MNSRADLSFEIEPGPETWSVTSPEAPPHRVANPLRSPEFVSLLVAFQEVACVAIDERDARKARRAWDIAARLGRSLADVLWSGAARQRVLERLNDAAHGRPRLTLRVRDEGEWGDRALALPWEILQVRPEGFAVRDGELDVVREVVLDGAQGIPVMNEPFCVAVTIAAPENQAALDYEKEAFRLYEAVTPLGHRAVFAELGTVDDLVRLVDRLQPRAIHFSGHGLPGELVFETDEGLATRVPIDDLVRELRIRVVRSGRDERLPALFFLAACHGATSASDSAEWASDPDILDRSTREIQTALGRGPSTAARLHRAGFAQVVGYFGPVTDELCTRTEAAFYRAIARGFTTLQAVAEARHATRMVAEDGHSTWPLAWSRIVLYHRGDDVPLAASLVDEPTWQRRYEREAVEVSGLPVLRHGFVGRRGLLHEVRRRYSGGDPLVVLQGTGGMGKTALASQLVAAVYARRAEEALILRCKEVDPDGCDPIHALWEQLLEHGYAAGLADWRRRSRQLRRRYDDPTRGFAATLRLLRAEIPRLFLYVDDVESLQVRGDGPDGSVGSWHARMRGWWPVIAAEMADGLRVLASTRHEWPELDPRHRLNVGPMDRGEMVRLVDAFPELGRLPAEGRSWVVEAADGLPWTLHLLDVLLGEERRRDGLGEVGDGWRRVVEPLLPRIGEQITAGLLLERLYEHLSPSGRELAAASSMLRTAAPLTVLQTIGASHDELARFGMLSLTRHLRRRDGGTHWESRWQMHPLIAAFVAARREPSADLALHRRIADGWRLWIDTGDPVWGDLVEATHHLLSVGASEDAWPLVEALVWHTLTTAEFGEGLELLDRCERAGLHGERLASAIRLRFHLDSLQSSGVNQTHVVLLEQALGLTRTDEGRAEILLDLGLVLGRTGRHVESEERLSEALALREALGAAVPAITEVRVRRAAALVQQGRNVEAELLARSCLTSMEDDVLALQILGQALLGQGRYAEAEELLHRALLGYEEILDAAHPAVVDSRWLLGHAKVGAGKPGEALALLETSLRQLERSHGAAHGAAIRTTQLVGRLYFQQGAFEEASAYFERALAAAEGLPGPVPALIAGCLKELGAARIELGEPVDAESLLRRSVAMAESAYGPDHPETADTLHQLAQALTDQGRPAEARPLLQRAVAIRRRTVGPRHPAYARALRLLAGAMTDSDALVEAEALMRQSLAVLADDPTVGPAVVADCHIELGRALLRGNRFMEALGEAERAFDALASHDTGRQARGAASLKAWALAHLGRFAEAEPLFRDLVSEAADSRRNARAGDSVRRGLAVVIARQGRTREALPLLSALAASTKEGRDILELARALVDVNRAREAEKVAADLLAEQEERYGPESPVLRATLLELARAVMDTRPAEAEVLLRRALAIASEGPPGLLVASLIEKLAYALLHQMRFREAREAADRALSVRASILGPRHPAVIETLLFAAFLARELLDPACAEAFLRDGLSRFDESAGCTPVHRLDLLLALGTTLRMDRRPREALDVFQEGFALAEERLDPSHARSAAASLELGGSLFAFGRVAEAAPLLERAHAEFERRASPRDPNRVACLRAIARLRSAQGRAADARACVEQALVLTEAHVGRRHPEYGRLLSWLADFAEAANDLAAAEGLRREGHAISEAAAGAGNPRTLEHSCALAALLHRRGKTGEAADFLDRTRAAVTGGPHDGCPEHSQLLHQLSSYEELRGRDLLAERHLAEAITQIRRREGEGSANVATLGSTRARLLGLLGRNDEALALARETVATLEATLGERHPNTIRAIRVLSTQLRSKGNADADAVEERALALALDVLGPRHASTLSIRAGRATRLYHAHRFEEAEQEARGVLAVQEAVFGPMHPEVASMVACLAGCLRGLGRLEEAASLAERRFALVRAAFGDEGAPAGWALYELALIRDAADDRRAAGTAERALALLRGALNPGDPLLSQARDRLVPISQRPHDRIDAGALLRQAGHLIREVDPAKGRTLLRPLLGERAVAEAPSAAAQALAFYGEALVAEGKLAEARPFAERALALAERVGLTGSLAEMRTLLASTRGEVLSQHGQRLQRRALVHRHEGRFAQAIPIYRELLSYARRTIGRAHPDLCPILFNLAFCLRAAGKAAEALPHATAAVSVADASMGETSRDRARVFAELALVQRDARHPDAAKTAALAISRLDAAFGPQSAEVAALRDDLRLQAADAGLPVEVSRILGEADDLVRSGHAHIAVDLLGAFLEVLAPSGESLAAERVRLKREEARQDIASRAERESERQWLADAEERIARAETLATAGRLADAGEALLDALSFQRQVLPREDPRHMPLLTRLVANLCAQGRYAEALPYAESQMERVDEVLATDPTGRARVAARLAEIKGAIDHPTAVDAARDALRRLAEVPDRASIADLEALLVRIVEPPYDLSALMARATARIEAGRIAEVRREGEALVAGAGGSEEKEYIGKCLLLMASLRDEDPAPALVLAQQIRDASKRHLDAAAMASMDELIQTLTDELTGAG